MGTLLAKIIAWTKRWPTIPKKPEGVFNSKTLHKKGGGRVELLGTIRSVKETDYR